MTTALFIILIILAAANGFLITYTLQKRREYSDFDEELDILSEKHEDDLYARDKQIQELADWIKTARWAVNKDLEEDLDEIVYNNTPTTSVIER